MEGCQISKMVWENWLIKETFSLCYQTMKVFQISSVKSFLCGDLFLKTTINKCVLGSISPTCLQAAFTCAYPKSTKRQSSRQCLFAFSVSTGAKAARKTLLKLTWPLNELSAATLWVYGIFFIFIISNWTASFSMTSPRSFAATSQSIFQGKLSNVFWANSFKLFE